jgi:hypothetical protein
MAERFLERFSCASRSATQGRLQLGESFLKRRKIWAKEKLTAASFDGASHPGSLLDAQIIHHDASTGEGPETPAAEPLCEERPSDDLIRRTS